MTTPPLKFPGRITHYSAESGFGTISTPDEREFLFQGTHVSNAGLRGIPVGADVEIALSDEKIESVELRTAERFNDELLEGELVDCRPERGFGFINTSTSGRFFVHISEFFPRKNVLPKDGENVVFEPKRTERGPEATKVQLLRDLKSEISKKLAAKEFLDAALIKKADGDFQGARELYERGLKSAPSVQLILSYAAMERERRDLGTALEVLQRGIKQFPTNGKLYADAGKLAIGLRQFLLAIEICERGITNVDSQKGGRSELTELLGIAYFQGQDYQKAEQYFLEVRKTRRAPSIERQFLQAWMRNHCPIAENTRRFFNACNFTMKDIRTPNQTHCIDFLFESKNTAIAASYGLESSIFVRCFVKQDPTQADVEETLRAMKELSRQANICQEAMLLVMHSAGHLNQYLVQLADKPSQRPICVVLDSKDVQTSLEVALQLLRKRLDEWLYRRNLYAERFPVTGASFFGRNQVLKEIEGQINTGNHVGIFGLRKTGKTSLLYSLRDRLIQDIVVYLDLQQFGGDVPLAAVCRKILEETNRQLAEKFNGTPLLTKTKTLDSTMGEIARLMDGIRVKRRDARFVLLIDEVERMAPAGGGAASGWEFFSAIRGTSQQSRNIISIICGADPSIVLSGKWGEQDNPVFHFYHPIYLPPLEKNECFDMITHLGRGMGVFYEEPALDCIYQETFGHPAITRGLCSKITQEKRERPLSVSAEMVEAFASEFSFVEAELLKEILERFSHKPMERTILELIISAGGEVDESQLLKLVKGGEWDSLRRLLNFSVLVKHGSKYTLSMGLLKRCLSREGF